MFHIIQKSCISFCRLQKYRTQMNALLWVHAQSNVANLIQCDKSAFVFNRKHKIYYNNKFCYSKTSGEDLKSLETISSQIEYDQIAEETLQSIGDHVEEILASSDLQDWDVTYNNGVLTISLNDHGTYVINKQSPNKQIWLSSPFSGPKSMTSIMEYGFINRMVYHCMNY